VHYWKCEKWLRRLTEEWCERRAKKRKVKKRESERGMRLLLGGEERR